MKKLTILAVLAALSTSAFAMKIGYVNSQEILFKSSQGEKARTTLETKQKELENKIKLKEIELKKLEIELQGKGKNITEEDKKALNDKYEQFQKMMRDSQTELSKEEMKQMQEVSSLMNRSIQNVARTGGYDYILEQGALRYGGENITPKVLEVMNKSVKITK